MEIKPCPKCSRKEIHHYHGGYAEPHLPVMQVSERLYFWFECAYCQWESRAAETQAEAQSFWNQRISRPHYVPFPAANALQQYEAVALTHQLLGLTRTLRERYLPEVLPYWNSQMEGYLTAIQAQAEEMLVAVRDHHLPWDSIG